MGPFSFNCLPRSSNSFFVRAFICFLSALLCLCCWFLVFVSCVFRCIFGISSCFCSFCSSYSTDLCSEKYQFPSFSNSLLSTKITCTTRDAIVAHEPWGNKAEVGFLLCPLLKITFLTFTYPKAYTGRVPLCPLILSRFVLTASTLRKMSNLTRTPRKTKTNWFLFSLKQLSICK